MTIDAALPQSLPDALAGPVESASPAVPGADAFVDAADPALPLAPLAPIEIAAVPGPGRLLRVARATLAVLAHPYPRRAPRPPLTREEHQALARNELAREERERQAYRSMALGGGPLR